MTPDPLAHPVGLPPGPYRVEWPAEQGGAFTLWGRQGTPPDFKDGWAIPLVASGVDTAMYALCDMLNAASPETTPAGVLDEAWAAAEKALPEGWVLDGYRRLYDEGYPAERWVARAVQPMRDDEKPDDWFAPLRVGTAATPAAALQALAAALGRSGSGGGRG